MKTTNDVESKNHDGFANNQREMSLDQEQKGLLNYDEFLALWYFALAIWYGYISFQNWSMRMSVRQNQYRQLQQEQQPQPWLFTKMHWFIFSIFITGLANFLFSLSLLEVLDHRSRIGGTVKKLSYANMILACLRHPCTLSLGVLAPHVAFSDGVIVPWLGPGGMRLPSGTKRTAMCLAALSCAQVVIRLTENLLILFRYGRRDTSSIRLADFFEFVLDGVFLSWMMLNLSNATRQISRDYGGRFAWWNSHKLIFFWVLYSSFVLISAIQNVVGILHYIISTATLSEHYIYTSYKIRSINDLMLLSGIAILLRPTKQHQTYHGTFNDDGDATEPGMQLDGYGIEADDTTTDYTLLIPNGNGRNFGNYEPGVIFEMTAPTGGSVVDTVMQPS